MGNSPGTVYYCTFSQDILFVVQPDFHFSAQVMRVPVLAPEKSDYLIEVVAVRDFYIGRRLAVFFHHPNCVKV